ncbi:MAG: helix-turn-helix transcriptional regulator [Polyangiaceae bacterium]|nr:helix-turn-helix transcriptional regulator [Myxococcales bacterium]MCB9586176.1 helix-turn-helix transcriptional regulator [Polyangiaceae bacterium]MCB9606853.1 helix-turn-helix transcriptional regulator [Polyangiaceae bacterium]
MDRLNELPVSLPGLSAGRGTTSSRHTGMKEHFGVGRIESGDTEWWGNGRAWRSRAGSILLKQPGDVVRHLSHAGPTTFTVVRLPTDMVLQAKAQLRAGVVHPQLEPGDERAAPFHRLIDAIEAQADSFTLEVLLAESICAFTPLSGGLPDYSRPVKRAVDCLRASLSQAITLDQLAAEAAYDKFHLCRAFRKEIGMPPHRYLTHLRIAEAKRLLRAGVRASDLAPLLGFYDQAQLTKHFKRIVGTTPARFAKGRRGIEDQYQLYTREC